MVHFLVPPGGGPVPHVHLRDEEVFFIASGKSSFWSDGAILEGEAGDAAVLPRQIIHAFRNRSDEPTEFITVCTPAGFDEFVRRSGQPARAGEQPPAPDDAEKKRLVENSTAFGVDMHPEVTW